MCVNICYKWRRSILFWRCLHLLVQPVDLNSASSFLSFSLSGCQSYVCDCVSVCRVHRRHPSVNPSPHSVTAGRAMTWRQKRRGTAESFQLLIESGLLSLFPQPVVGLHLSSEALSTSCGGGQWVGWHFSTSHYIQCQRPVETSGPSRVFSFSLHRSGFPCWDEASSLNYTHFNRFYRAASARVDFVTFQVKY